MNAESNNLKFDFVEDSDSLTTPEQSNFICTEKEYSSLSCSSDEEDRGSQEYDTNQSNSDTEEISCREIKIQRNGVKFLPFLLFYIPFKIFYYLLIGSVKGIINMIDSDINAMVGLFSKVLGISPQRFNSKFIKQVFIIALLVVVFVQSRKDEKENGFKHKPFFPEYSLVADFYNGEIKNLRKEIENSDISLVMYYAPWDRQCQDFVPHFLETAYYFHEQVTFCAINCWLPKGDCQVNFKFHRYPLIVLHVRSGNHRESLAVPYNGPLSSHYLIKFVSEALRPYTYMTNKRQIYETVQLNEAVVLGYFGSEASEHEFHMFYSAALNKLQHDRLSEVKFGVLSDDKLAHSFSFSWPSGIQMKTKYMTYMYPQKAEKNMRNITRFIQNYLRKPYNWLHIKTTKSLDLDAFLRKGPLLIAFIPDNPYSPTNDWFQLVKSVASDYSCNERVPAMYRDPINFKEREWFQQARFRCQMHARNVLEYRRQASECPEEKEQLEMCEFESVPQFPFMTLKSYWNKFEWNDAFLFHPDASQQTRHCPLDDSTLWVKHQSNYYPANRTFPRMKLRQPEPNSDGPIADDRIQSLMNAVDEDNCKRLILSGNFADSLPSPDDHRGHDLIGIKNLGCSGNQTLQFVAVDSKLHRDVAEYFGLKFSETGSMIVDSKNEEMYFMKGAISRRNLEEFIYNFSMNQLDRGMKIHVKRSRSDSAEAVQELDARSYAGMVNNTERGFLALHYTSHCGACIAVENVFVRTSKLLAGATNLAFGRIDVSSNTLPWHLTFSTVPTIIFYPRGKRSESMVFDERLPVTVKNLVAFVLPNFTSLQRNTISRRMCNEDCQQKVRSKILIEKYKISIRAKNLAQKLKKHESEVKKIFNLKRDSLNLLKFHIYSSLISSNARKLKLLKLEIKHLDQLDHNYI